MAKSKINQDRNRDKARASNKGGNTNAAPLSGQAAAQEWQSTARSRSESPISSKYNQRTPDYFSGSGQNQYGAQSTSYQSEAPKRTRFGNAGGEDAGGGGQGTPWQPPVYDPAKYGPQPIGPQPIAKPKVPGWASNFPDFTTQSQTPAWQQAPSYGPSASEPTQTTPTWAQAFQTFPNYTTPSQTPVWEQTPTWAQPTRVYGPPVSPAPVKRTGMNNSQSVPVAPVQGGSDMFPVTPGAANVQGAFAGSLPGDYNTTVASPKFTIPTMPKASSPYSSSYKGWGRGGGGRGGGGWSDWGDGGGGGGYVPNWAWNLVNWNLG